MSCNQLAERVEQIEPIANLQEVARACLLLSNAVESPNDLDDGELLRSWREIGLKLQLATDQHDAVTQELQDLAKSDPSEFSKEQIWILLRAIKVQSQVLELYLGEPAVDI